MSWRRVSALFLVSISCVPAASSLWLDKLGDLKKVSSKPVQVQDKDLWDEYGLEAAESAQYAGAGKTLNGTMYRLKDPTGGLAVFQMLRPAGAKKSKATDVSVDLPNGGLMALLGNYVVVFDGKPSELQLKQFYFNLPRVDQSSLPALYLPPKGLVPNSERYVAGPVSLAKFAPQFSPSLVSFSLGAEGQIARYNGDMQLAVFTYPTPQIARQKLDEFLKIPNSRAKRASHMVAVISDPKSADDAERLLAFINYEPNVTIHDTGVVKRENPGDLILGSVLLAAALGVLSIIFGVFFGGFRVMLGRFGFKSPSDSFTALEIDKK